VSRILGIDYGTVRIGLALSDPTGTLASPLPCWENKSIPQIRTSLAELVQNHGISKIIVGLPRNMDGSYGPAAEKVRSFISQIQPNLEIPIETQDERLTTVQASKQLSSMGLSQRDLRMKVDSSSASLILQQYLDRKSLTA
jgi:putative Holliday junction resolvase